MTAQVRRVRVRLSPAQQRAQVRTLGFGAVVAVGLAAVLVVVAVEADGWPRWLAAIAALLPVCLAVLAGRTALVLSRLPEPPLPEPPLPEPPLPAPEAARCAVPPAAGERKLPVNLGRLEREAASAAPPDSSTEPV